MVWGDDEMREDGRGEEQFSTPAQTSAVAVSTRGGPSWSQRYLEGYFFFKLTQWRIG
jgi:hypothetical protein